ncbi:hypothetical protein [Aquimarina algiphila]|uniref:Uncharacterized protein n=1 Tax=Aquimarina algiphila TaxID=2047982 RepID=A0A554VRG5_9FLAO|nr:hypothetical protein [Aquimarina algiphila]TSE11254.1 hypothetical protein FOF46_01100 [Aquimarina algiphila]
METRASRILKEVLKYTGARTINALAEIIEVKRDRLYKIEKGETSAISENLIKIIVKRYPEINSQYLRGNVDINDMVLSDIKDINASRNLLINDIPTKEDLIILNQQKILSNQEEILDLLNKKSGDL